MRTLDPSNDYVFKILFKDPGDERRLVAMLNAIVDPPSPIVSATVLSPQIPADVATAKTTHVELTDQLEIHLLDLRKLATDGTLSLPLRRWAEFFDHPTEAVLERLAEEDEIMADTIHKLRTVSADDQAYYIAEARFRGEFRQRSDLRAEREDGRVEGELLALSRAVIGVLKARFGQVPDELRATIAATDASGLESALSRAAVVPTLEEFTHSGTARDPSGRSEV